MIGLGGWEFESLEEFELGLGGALLGCQQSAGFLGLDDRQQHDAPEDFDLGLVSQRG